MRRRGCGGCIVPILVVVGVLAVVGAIGDALSGIGRFEPADEPTTEGVTIDGDVILSNVTPKAFCYYYDCLTSKEKTAYDYAVAALQQGKDTVVIPASVGIETIDEIEEVALSVLYDHPEFHWLRGYRARGNGQRWTVSFDAFAFWTYSTSHQKHVKELDDAVEQVAALARQSASDDYGRVKFVHDYLCETAAYDYDALEEYERANHSASCEYIYTAYGCLINHRTVCAGYAKAFRLILNRLGIGCDYVCGDAGGSHAWNRVTINGEGYYVDVTWDDEDGDDYSCASYDYLNITTKELLKTRSIDDKFPQPVCIADRYNYYVYNDYVIDDYCLDRIEEIAARQKRDPIFTFKFSNVRDFNRAVDDMMDGKWYAVDQSLTCRYYSINDDLLIITLIR